MLLCAVVYLTVVFYFGQQLSPIVQLKVKFDLKANKGKSLVLVPV